jgi:hypothetical protein
MNMQIVLFVAIWAALVFAGTKYKWSIVQSVLGGLLIAALAMFPLSLALSAFTEKEAAPIVAEIKEPVLNSSYDGSVRQVEDWLEKNFNDPKSIERIEWSKVVKTEQGNYVVRYKFRAKNESGGMQIYNKAFILGSTGIVIAMSDFDS